MAQDAKSSDLDMSTGLRVARLFETLQRSCLDGDFKKICNDASNIGDLIADYSASETATGRELMPPSQLMLLAHACILNLIRSPAITVVKSDGKCSARQRLAQAELLRLLCSAHIYSDYQLYCNFAPDAVTGSFTSTFGKGAVSRLQAALSSAFLADSPVDAVKKLRMLTSLFIGAQDNSKEPSPTRDIMRFPRHLISDLSGPAPDKFNQDFTIVINNGRFMTATPWEYAATHGTINPSLMDHRLMGMPLKEISKPYTYLDRVIAGGGGYIPALGSWVNLLYGTKTNKGSMYMLYATGVTELSAPATMMSRCFSLLELDEFKLIAMYPLVNQHTTNPTDFEIVLVIKRAEGLFHFKLPTVLSNDDTQARIELRRIINLKETPTAEDTVKATDLENGVDDVSSQCSQRLTSAVCGYNFPAKLGNAIHVTCDTIHRAVVRRTHDGLVSVQIFVHGQGVKPSIKSHTLKHSEVERVFVVGGQCVISTNNATEFHSIYDGKHILHAFNDPCHAASMLIFGAWHKTANIFGNAIQCIFVMGNLGKSYCTYASIGDGTCPLQALPVSSWLPESKVAQRFTDFLNDVNCIYTPEEVVRRGISMAQKPSVAVKLFTYTHIIPAIPVPQWYCRPFDAGAIANRYNIVEQNAPKQQNQFFGQFATLCAKPINAPDAAFSGGFSAPSASRKRAPQRPVVPEVKDPYEAWELDEMVYDRYDILFTQHRHPFIVPPPSEKSDSVVCVHKWSSLTAPNTVNCLYAAWAFCHTHKTGFPLRRFHTIALYLLQKSAPLVHTQVSNSMDQYTHTAYHPDGVTHEPHTASLCDFTGVTERPIHLHTDFIRRSSDADVKLAYWLCCYLLIQPPKLSQPLRVVADPMEYIRDKDDIDPSRYINQLWRDTYTQESTGLVGLYNLTDHPIGYNDAINVVDNIVKRWITSHQSSQTDYRVPEFLRPTYLDACYVCDMSDESDRTPQDIHLLLCGRINAHESGFAHTFAAGKRVPAEFFPSCAATGTDLASYAVLYADTLFNRTINWQSAIPTIVRSARLKHTKSVSLSTSDPAYIRLHSQALNTARKFVKHQTESGEFTSPTVTLSQAQLQKVQARLDAHQAVALKA